MDSEITEELCCLFSSQDFRKDCAIPGLLTDCPRQSFSNGSSVFDDSCTVVRDKSGFLFLVVIDVLFNYLNPQGENSSSIAAGRCLKWSIARTTAPTEHLFLLGNIKFLSIRRTYAKDSL